MMKRRRGVRLTRGQHTHARVAFFLELGDMRAVVPLPVARVYFFAVWTNETLLPADARRIELIVFEVLTGELRLIGGGHGALSVWIGLENVLSVALFCVLEGDIVPPRVWMESLWTGWG